MKRNNPGPGSGFSGLLGGTIARLNAAPFDPNPQDAQSDAKAAKEKQAGPSVSGSQALAQKLTSSPGAWEK
jgi:hypothetical protein